MEPNVDVRTGRVLFVDDEPAMLSSLRRIFRKDVYEVESALNGASGLEAFTRFRPAVVVSDQGTISGTVSGCRPRRCRYALCCS